MISNNDKKKLGKRIKELRIAQSLSQEELCDRAGLSESSYISKIETGKYTPSIFLLLKIINALGVSPDTFFDFQHLATEEELDEQVLKEYASLPLKKKQTFYRYLQILKDYN